MRYANRIFATSDGCLADIHARILEADVVFVGTLLTYGTLDALALSVGISSEALWTLASRSMVDGYASGVQAANSGVVATISAFENSSDGNAGR